MDPVLLGLGAVVLFASTRQSGSVAPTPAPRQRHDPTLQDRLQGAAVGGIAGHSVAIPAALIAGGVGATVGSAVPVIGTVIGGGFGAAMGAGWGATLGAAGGALVGFLQPDDPVVITGAII